jgi:hypothetical protein
VQDAAVESEADDLDWHEAVMDADAARASGRLAR